MPDVTLYITDEEAANLERIVETMEDAGVLAVTAEEVLLRSLRTAVASPLRPPIGQTRGSGSLADFGDTSNC